MQARGLIRAADGLLSVVAIIQEHGIRIFELLRERDGQQLYSDDDDGAVALVRLSRTLLSVHCVYGDCQLIGHVAD